jgi:hypothetical protein
MNKMDPLQMVMQIKQNPGKFLVQRGLNIPSGILNDPNKIIQHLMNTGQISQEQYNNAIKQAQNFGIKVG